MSTSHGTALVVDMFERVQHVVPLLQAYTPGYEVPGLYGHLPQGEHGINGTWDHAQHQYLQHMHQQHAYTQVSRGSYVQAQVLAHDMGVARNYAGSYVQAMAEPHVHTQMYQDV